MAIELIDKIKQKNNGTFKLVDAIDVEVENGSDLQSTIDQLEENVTQNKDSVISLSDKINDHFINHPEQSSECDIYVGDEIPLEDEKEFQVWIDTSDDEQITSKIEDSIIDEFRQLFISLNNEIAELKNVILNHERRIVYLELHGGGGIPPTPEPTDSDVLIFEDGSTMVFEDGTIMIFEKDDIVVPTNNPKMALEDGSIMIFEDGSVMVFEKEQISTSTFMIFENKDLMKFEDNSTMIFE